MGEALEETLEEDIMDALENVIDPELGVDIVNLGLVYGISLDDQNICTVTMTLTTMGCPLQGIIEQEVQRALNDVPGVEGAEVNIVWDPPWGKDKMSRYAKIALGIPD